MKTARPLFAPQGRVVVVVMAEHPNVSSVQWLIGAVRTPTIVAVLRKQADDNLNDTERSTLSGIWLLNQIIVANNQIYLCNKGHVPTWYGKVSLDGCMNL